MTPAQPLPFTPDEALREIARFRGERAALSRRTTGLTWVVWGLVLAGLVLSMHLWEALGVDEGPGAEAVENVQPLVAIAWLLLGYAVTRAIWRSAGLAVPGLGGLSPRERALRYAALAGIALLAALSTGFLRALGAPLHEDPTFLVVLGGLAGGMGALGVSCHDRVERATAVGVGALVAGGGLALGLLLGSGSAAVFALAGPMLLLVAFVGGGLGLMARG